MKSTFVFVLLAMILMSCNNNEGQTNKEKQTSLEGTWQLLSGTIIEKGDTTITDYTKDKSMIKIINATHFSFLNHDLKNGKDSTNMFVAGGGRYKLVGDQYTEFLEYCSDRAWEGHEFSFTVTIQNDTLIQKGIEKIEDAGINRQNLEKYVRVSQ